MSASSEGRTALVTGAAAGIGRAIVARLVADGATVIAGDIDEGGLATLTSEHGDSVVPSRCDVTSEDSVAALCDLATGRGGLDIAVANAGRGSFGAIVEQPLSEWQSIIDLCLTGVFLTIKHAAGAMNDGGSIITVSSLNAIQPAAGMSAYCTAKAGVAMLSKVAAMELGHRGIRVNSVAPGLVETNATAAFWELPGVVEEFVDNTTLGRHGVPADVANLVGFLASDASTFMSGGLYTIDGGAATKRYPDLPAAMARLAADSEPPPR